MALCEIEAVRGPGGLRVERDIHFEPLASLGVYAAAARHVDGIVEDQKSLAKAFLRLADTAHKNNESFFSFVLFDIEGAG